MRQLFSLIILFICTSCQYFDTEKISSDTFYEEEIKAIDWSEVDRYPTFEACDTLLVKTSQKSCFEEELAYFLQRGISDQGVMTIQDLNDTITVSFAVSSTAEIAIVTMQMDSLLVRQFPHLKDSLIHSIQSLKLVAPAYKRGVPVTTEFTLPIIVKTEAL